MISERSVVKRSRTVPVCRGGPCWDRYLPHTRSAAEPMPFALLCRVRRPHLATATACSPFRHGAGRTSNARAGEGPQLPRGGGRAESRGFRLLPQARGPQRCRALRCAAAGFGRARHCRGLALERGEASLAITQRLPRALPAPRLWHRNSLGAQPVTRRGRGTRCWRSRPQRG